MWTLPWNIVIPEPSPDDWVWRWAELFRKLPCSPAEELRRPLGSTGRKTKTSGDAGFILLSLPFARALLMPMIKILALPTRQHKGVIGQLWIYKNFFLLFLMSLSCINFIKPRIPQVNSKWRKRAACLEDVVIKPWVVKPSTDSKTSVCCLFGFHWDFCVLSANDPSGMRGHGDSGWAVCVAQGGYAGPGRERLAGLGFSWLELQDHLKHIMRNYWQTKLSLHRV